MPKLSRFLRPLKKYPATRLLLLVALLWLLVFEYCRLHYWRDPHSAFFDDRHVYEWKYSLFREHEARHLISVFNAPVDAPEAVKSSSAPGSSSKVDPLICAAVLTVRRGEDDYFDASIGSLLDGLEPSERRALWLNVIFADTNATRHPSWGQRWIERLADGTDAYDRVAEGELARLRELEGMRRFQEKGVLCVCQCIGPRFCADWCSDYIYALQSCQSTHAPYIAIFEDDIILAEGWMAKTIKGLTDVNKNKNKNWLYLRLFYTEISLSWTSSDFVYGHMLFVFLACMVSVFTALLAVRRYRLLRRRGHMYLDYPTLGVVSFIAVPAFLGLAFMIGKYTLMPLHGVVEMNSHGCCTQGLIFPRTQVDGLIAYLHDKKAGQTDELIETYAEQNGLTRYALAPQQLQHVGLASSRGNVLLNTQSTWAFWFEENEPGVLGEEHERAFWDGDVQRVLGEYA